MPFRRTVAVQAALTLPLMLLSALWLTGCSSPAVTEQARAAEQHGSLSTQQLESGALPTPTLVPVPLSFIGTTDPTPAPQPHPSIVPARPTAQQAAPTPAAAPPNVPVSNAEIVQQPVANPAQSAPIDAAPQPDPPAAQPQPQPNPPRTDQAAKREQASGKGQQKEPKPEKPDQRQEAPKPPKQEERKDEGGKGKKGK